MDEIRDRITKLEGKLDSLNDALHEIKEVTVMALRGDISGISSALESKVNWKQFWAIVAVLVSMVGGMFSLLYVEIKDTRNDVRTMQSDTSRTQSDVSFIRGKLDSASITP